MVPAELRYTKSHEWARMEEATNTVTIGISAFAVEQLGDIVFLELPSVGDSLKKDDSFGVIESVKAAVDLYSPVAGEVVEVNEALPDSLDLLGEDPYGKGWMVKIKADNKADLQDLMSAEEYEKFTREQALH